MWNIRIKWGATKYPSALRFHRTTVSRNDTKGNRIASDVFDEHPVAKWYGVTWGDSGFFGVILFNRRRNVWVRAKE